MRLSVVIPTHDRRESLARVLDALSPQRGEVPGGAEIVVVDDGSTNGTRGELAMRAERDALRVLTQANAGPARARNRGAAEASGELLLFLGDDTVPEPGFLATHDRAHRESGRAPRAILGYTGWDRERMRVTPFLVHLSERGLQFGFSLIADPENVPFNFFYTSNVSLPRATFRQLGGLDEEFPSAAWEDIEFAYRAVRETGLVLVYRPAARVRHEHPTTLDGFRARQRRVGAAAALLVKKHPELTSWLGVEEARRLQPRRPRHLALLRAAILALDPLGVPLPGCWYDAAVRRDYLEGLAEGLRPGGGTPG